MKLKPGFVAFFIFLLVLGLTNKVAADEVDSILNKARTMIKRATRPMMPPGF
jgi:F0F1-type ATP synthase membrane subunit b/b'